MIYGLITSREDEKKLIAKGCQRVSYVDPKFTGSRRDAVRDMIADQRHLHSTIMCLTAYDFATSLPGFKSLVDEVNDAGFTLHILDTGAKFAPNDTRAIDGFVTATSIYMMRGGAAAVKKRKEAARPVGRPRKKVVAE